jgi:hypothetical protein
MKFSTKVSNCHALQIKRHVNTATVYAAQIEIHLLILYFAMLSVGHISYMSLDRVMVIGKHALF